MVKQEPNLHRRVAYDSQSGGGGGAALKSKRRRKVRHWDAPKRPKKKPAIIAAADIVTADIKEDSLTPLAELLEPEL